MDSEFSSCDTLESLSQHGSSGPRNVPLEYLRNITNNFSYDRLLGEGGFGTVYKGLLPNGEMVAVKKLNSVLPGVNNKQFENEAYHLKRLKHRNIVLLVGWCSETKTEYVEHEGKHICAEKSERLLCLEYMPNGNLRQHLKDKSSELTWETRYKIIKGISYGLQYLHEVSQLSPIVHMDLKPANILLDNNMVPKIADFGLSRLFSVEKTKTFTISRDGTLGYMAPEYINRGIISKGSDIFSLGVIIIEIVTGQRDYPYEIGEKSSQEFTEDVLKKWKNRLTYTSPEIDYQQIRRCIQIGLDCVKPDRSKRPTIREVIKVLQGTESAVQSHPKLTNDNQETESAVQSHPMLINDNQIHSLASSRSSPVTILTGLKNFSYGDIKSATNNFNKDRLIAEDGFWKVYKGTFNIENHEMELAVKCATNPDGVKMIKDELMIHAKLGHKNVVPLVGFCNNDGWFQRGRQEMCICYEWMSNGSLDKHIFASSRQSVIKWPIRYQIIRGICSGLQYLHHDNSSIVHMDLKPSNILLDQEMMPKIAHFGLSRAHLNTKTHTYTDKVIGTKGYMAPEYVDRGEVGRACDIYSLGVLILAIVMGQGPEFTHDPCGVVFINKVREKFIIPGRWGATTPIKICSAKDREQLKKDASLQDNDCIEDVEKCVGLAFKCVNVKPEKRPTGADMSARLIYHSF